MFSLYLLRNSNKTLIVILCLRHHNTSSLLNKINWGDNLLRNLINNWMLILRNISRIHMLLINLIFWLLNILREILLFKCSSHELGLSKCYWLRFGETAKAWLLSWCWELIYSLIGFITGREATHLKIIYNILNSNFYL